MHNLDADPDSAALRATTMEQLADSLADHADRTGVQHSWRKPEFERPLTHRIRRPNPPDQKGCHRTREKRHRPTTNAGGPVCPRMQTSTAVSMYRILTLRINATAPCRLPRTILSRRAIARPRRHSSSCGVPLHLDDRSIRPTPGESLWRCNLPWRDAAATSRSRDRFRQSKTRSGRHLNSRLPRTDSPLLCEQRGCRVARRSIDRPDPIPKRMGIRSAFHIVDRRSGLRPRNWRSQRTDLPSFLEGREVTT